jgi:hypothetical protein
MVLPMNRAERRRAARSKQKLPVTKTRPEYIPEEPSKAWRRFERKLADKRGIERALQSRGRGAS